MSVHAAETANRADHFRSFLRFMYLPSLARPVSVRIRATKSAHITRHAFFFRLWTTIFLPF